MATLESALSLCSDYERPDWRELRETMRGLGDGAVIERALSDHFRRSTWLGLCIAEGRWKPAAALVPTATSSQQYGADHLRDAPLFLAASMGAVALLPALVSAGACPNMALRKRGHPLHAAIGAAQLTPARRLETVATLLRLGAVPELQDPHGRNAYLLARADAALASLLREQGGAYGPRQSREARALGVRDVRLRYERADGLIYRIGLPDMPYVIGGDHDGPMPCSLAEFEREFRSHQGDPAVQAFAPFMAQISAGEEFGFAALADALPARCLSRFDERPTWGMMID